MLCTFHTPRCVPAIVFRMPVFLTAHALGISRLEWGVSNFTIEFKRVLIRYMSLLLVLGLRSIKCMGKG
jgi:hypothetical protein